MRTIVIKDRIVIPLGRIGDNEATTIKFNIASFFPGLSGAQYELVHKRPNDPNAYPVLQKENGRVRDGFINWVVTSSDLGSIAGNGVAQLSAYVGDTRVRSVVFTTQIANGMGFGPKPDDPEDPWVENVLEAGRTARDAASSAAVDADRAEAAANGIEATIDAALTAAKASGEFDGEDGYSPTVTVQSIPGGHRVTITDVDGDHVFDVMDGEDGSGGGGEGGGGSAASLDYKWLAQGYMREQYAQFQGWAHNVVWEPKLKCAVGFIISGTTEHSATNPWVRVAIDRNGYMSTYEAVTLLDTDGETPYTPPYDSENQYYMGSFIRASDGTYYIVDRARNIYTSVDYGKTLIRQNQPTFASTGSMFGLKQLSNGRFLLGFGNNYNGFYYSDDLGLTWTATSAEVVQSKIGKQTYPEGQYKPFEPCFIDCGNGRVICYARKSTNAQVSGPVNSYERLEPAVFSKSSDYGSTWTAWENSAKITDMTANNAKTVIVDGIVHMIFGSRYKATDSPFHLYYTYATIEDAYADNWATPVIVDIGHWKSNAANQHDSGYPSVWADDLNNLYAVYYDGDGTNSYAAANWRLCTAAPVEKKPAVEDDGSGAFNVAYSQKMVDQKINKIMSKINYLFMAIGEPQEDSGAYDGSNVIMSGLTAWFTPGNSTKWDGYNLTALVGENLTAIGCNPHATQYGAQSDKWVIPTKFENGFAYDVSALWGGIKSTTPEVTFFSLSDMGLSEAEAFTIEIVSFSTSNDNVFMLKPGPSNNNAVWSLGRTIASVSYQNATHHFTMVFVPDTSDATKSYVRVYVDGQRKTTYHPTITIASLLGNVPLFCGNHSSGYYSYINDCRVYNRALTNDEIHNNYLYSSAYIDFTAGRPTFGN